MVLEGALGMLPLQTNFIFTTSPGSNNRTFQRFRVSLPPIHGAKPGGKQGLIYDEDTILMSSFVEHLELAMYKLPVFDFAFVHIEELRLGSMLIDPTFHGTKHVYISDILKLPFCMITKWSLAPTNAAHRRRHKKTPESMQKFTQDAETIKEVEGRVAWQQFADAAEKSIASGDFRNSDFAQGMALKSGGGAAARAIIKKQKAEMNMRRAYLQKTEETYQLVKENLRVVSFDNDYFGAMLHHAIVQNYDGDYASFEQSMKNAYHYFVSVGTKKDRIACLKRNAQFAVALFKAQMFSEMITVKLLLLQTNTVGPNAAQLRTDLGLAYDSLGNFKEGAKLHREARIQFREDIESHGNQHILAYKPEWYLARYTRSVTDYVRYMYYALGSAGGWPSTDTPVDAMDQLSRTRLFSSGWRALSEKEVTAMEQRTQNLNIRKNDVARLYASNLTKADFFAEYGNQGRPAIISYNDAPSVFDRTDRLWGKKILLERYGNLVFDVSKSSEIAPSQNYAVNQSTLQRVGARQMTVKEYVGTVLQNQDDSVDCPYLFSTGQPKVIEDIDEPVYFQGQERFALNRRARDQKALFYIGPPGSSTYFHQHSTAYNYLSAGRKKWYLFPPAMNFGPSVMTLPEWLGTVYHALPRKPIEVLQYPGEVLFVPNGWSHAVYNVDEVVGIAFEIGPDMTLRDDAISDRLDQDFSHHRQIIEEQQVDSSTITEERGTSLFGKLFGW